MKKSLFDGILTLLVILSIFGLMLGGSMIESEITGDGLAVIILSSAVAITSIGIGVSKYGW